MRGRFWLCGFAFAAAVLFGHVSAAGQERDVQKYKDFVERISRYNRAKIDDTVAWKQERLQGLERLGEEVEKEYRTSDPEIYARLTVSVCGGLHGVDLMDRRRHSLAQRYAMAALEKRAEFSLELQCDLVGYVTQGIDTEGKALKGDEFAALRKQQAVLWLDTWKRIEATIEKDWDPKDPKNRVYLNLAPPLETGLPSGVGPEAIEDPKLRAQFEADIEENRRKAEKYNIQSIARDRQKYWIPWAKRFLIGTYMEAPDKIEELRVLLEDYVENEADRKQILDAVKYKQLPDELELKNTTQPAR